MTEQSPQREPLARASRRGMWAWAWYDWASSAYATIVLTFVFAAYFASEVAVDKTTGSIQWVFALGITGVVVAMGAPLLGATIDQSGRRKHWLAGFTLLCITATAMLWFVRPTQHDVWLALLLVAVGELSMEYAGVAYNAMLPRLASAERIGRWSGWGWATGYAGGLGCLIVALVVFVQREYPLFDLNIEQAEHIRATFLLAAVWFAVFAVPLFLFTPDVPRTSKPLRRAARDGLHQLVDSFRQIRRYRHIVRFLIARLIYIDGLATVFIFGGVYAVGTFGFTAQGVLLFGIAINITAGLGAAAFGWIDDWIGSKRTILLSLIGLILPGIGLLFAPTATWFWILGLVLGIFVGPVQAASRSFMAHLAPSELQNQMFGLYAFSGKVAFLCPLLVGALTWLTASQRVGMSVVILFFVTGFMIMLTVPAAEGDHKMSG